VKDFLSITSALSDQNRVRILMALQPGELCVCQIIELLDLAPSTISKHMSILKQANLVNGRKIGRWVYYCLAEDTKSQAVQEAFEWIKKRLTSDRQIKRDAKRLKTILKHNPVDVCKKQREAR